MFNERIQTRKLYSGFDETTYYTQDLFKFAVRNYQDPDVLFKVKILGKYKKDYKWTDKQAMSFIDRPLLGDP